MFIAEIKHVIEQISRDKGIDRDVLVKAVEEAIQSAARKKFGNGIDIETQYDEKTGEIEVFQFMDVVETIVDPHQGSLVILEVEDCSLTIEDTGLDDHIKVLMQDPRITL